jgi:hypothetical protein
VTGPMALLASRDARLVSSNGVGTASDERALSMLPSPSRGDTERVGSCELRFALGTGGMATVYLGIHRGAQGFEKVVAVKRLLPGLCADPYYIAMLADEAWVSSNANHPCIRDVFDLRMTDDGSPYL